MMTSAEPSLIPPGTESSSAVQPGSQEQSHRKGHRRIWSSPKMKLKLPAINEVTWSQVAKASKEFLADPVNLALLVWVLLSVPACVIIALIKLGLMDAIITDAYEREHVDEVCTQIVNALFVLTCLIVFPLLMRHTFLLWRWDPEDKVELRKAFCKNGRRKPHDRTHIAMVVFWGQLTCWTTFAFAAIYWVWPSGQRPVSLITVTFAASMIAPLVGILYLLLSPLSKDYDIVKEGDEELIRMFEQRQAFFLSNREVKDAQWAGTVVPGCCNDPKVALFTCLLPCCMFGYNMERLGFGNRVVHTLAFLIVLFGPLLVFFFSASALRHLGVTEKIIYYSGVVLAFCGVAYGGAWRMKMRETYKLPGSKLFCGSKRLTDVCFWIWCSCCTLCQEIRTTDQYQIEDTSYYQMAPGNQALSAAVVAVSDEDDFVDEAGAKQQQLLTNFRPQTLPPRAHAPDEGVDAHSLSLPLPVHIPSNLPSI